MKNHQYDEVSDIIRLMALSAMAGNVFHFHYSSIFRSVLMSREMDVPVIVAVIATSETARPDAAAEQQSSRALLPAAAAEQSSSSRAAASHFPKRRRGTSCCFPSGGACTPRFSVPRSG